MFTSDPSLYRAYTSLAAIKGVGYVEFCPGGFHAQPPFRNEGSVFVDFDGIGPFARLIRTVAPSFRLHDLMRLDPSQLRPLLTAFERFGTALIHARTAADLERINVDVVVSEDEAAIARAHLIRSVAAFEDVIWRAYARRRCLWVL